MTASEIKTSTENRGEYSVSVTKTAFGSINAYVIKSKANASDGTVIDTVSITFISDSTMHNIVIAWGVNADKNQVQTNIDNILVNGQKANPAYRLY
ncbi:MAG: hypothetical protein IJG63_07305 [Oscillospiraceae bacterium]|nr:hypothetical protein [Oscillospiraceae bacterium]